MSEEVIKEVTSSVFKYILPDTWSEAKKEENSIAAERVVEAIKYGKDVEIKNAVIEGPLILKSVNVEGEVTIQRTKIRGLIDWSYATFKRVLNLENSIFEFETDATFTAVTVEKDIFLDGATFCGEAKFSDVTVMGAFYSRSTTFKKDVIFSDGIVKKGIAFTKSTFVGNAYFGRARISSAANFRGAEFKQRASFNGAQIDGHAFFNPYLFNIDVEFDDDLNKGIISEKLKEIFKAEGFTISQNAKVTKDKGDNRVITDGEKNHIVKKEDGKLNIYNLSTTFVGEANFGSARIGGKAMFTGATFVDDADFVSARIDINAEFIGAEFKKQANFNSAQIDGHAFFKPANLFNIDVEFKDDLNNGNISEKMKNIFKTKDYSLSENAIVTKDKGDNWVITDGGKNHIVKKEDGKLKIYNPATFVGEANFGSARIGGNAEFLGAVFKKRASFNSAQIDGAAFFNHATFVDEANFVSARVGSNADFNGAVFKEQANFNGSQINGAAFFNHATFVDEANFGSARIGVTAEFQKATFKKRGSFNRAHIEKSAFFNQATFWGEANFVSARIGSKAKFIGAEFKQQAIFKSAKIDGEALFKSAIFVGDADFGSARVGSNAKFNGAVFKGRDSFNSAERLFKRFPLLSSRAKPKGRASFKGAQVDGDALFKSAIFEDEADFVSARIGGTAEFQEATFKKQASFNRARIEESAFFNQATFWGEANFVSARIGIRAKFIGAEFKQRAKFNSAQIERESHFEGTVFANDVSFQNASLRTFIFGEPNVQFIKNIDLLGCTYDRIQPIPFWKQLMEHLDPYDRRPFTQLEETFRRAGKDELADDVYYERKCREYTENIAIRKPIGWAAWLHSALRKHGSWRALLCSALRKLSALLLDRFLLCFTGYGVRLYRLLEAFILILMLGTVIFQLEGAVTPELHSALPWSEAFWVSLNTFLPVIEIPSGADWKPSSQIIPYLGIKFTTFATLLVLAGWILVPVGVAGIAGLLKRPK